MAYKYLGLYHGVCAQYSLHDESKWLGDMDECDLEVRRRIWWAMYRLEIHTACVLGSLIRCTERQSNVGYPSGIHHPPFIPGRDGQYEDWFSGWMPRRTYTECLSMLSLSSELKDVHNLPSCKIAKIL